MRKWIIAFTAIFLGLLAFDVVPELRGGWGWQWPYAKPEDMTQIVILAAIAVLYLVGIIVLRSMNGRLMLHMLWAIVMGFGLALGVQNVRDDPFFMLFSHTVSPVQTGASTVATRFIAEEGVSASLNRWPDVMREANELTITHFTTSPPGKALVHYWLADVLNPITPISEPLSRELRPYQCSTLNVMEYDRGEMSSAGLGMLMPLWATLAVIPLGLIVLQFGGTQTQAARVVVWWPLVPSLLLFAPTWNTLYPLLALIAFVLLLGGIQRQQLFAVALSGLVMSWMLFLNFSLLPLLGFYGFFTLFYWFFLLRDAHSVRWPFVVGAWFGAGLSSIWIIFWLYSGLTPFDLLDVTFDQHLEIERNYWIWLVLHVYDMLMFAGWPLVLLGCWGIVRAFRRWRSNDLKASDVLVFSLILTVLILDVSGITRAESARIWLFFVPFILLAGWDVLAAQEWRWDVPLLGMQLASVVVMGAVLPVVAFDMNPLVEEPRRDVGRLDWLDIVPRDIHFESRDFAGAFSLTGYRFIGDPSTQIVTVELIWQGQVSTERPYQFEMVAVAENEIDGVVQSEPFYWYPQNGNYLSPCWRAGDEIVDVVVLPVPPVSMPVQWTLQVRPVHPDDVVLARGDHAENGYGLSEPIPYP